MPFIVTVFLFHASKETIYTSTCKANIYGSLPGEMDLRLMQI